MKQEHWQCKLNCVFIETHIFINMGLEEKKKWKRRERITKVERETCLEKSNYFDDHNEGMSTNEFFLALIIIRCHQRLLLLWLLYDYEGPETETSGINIKNNMKKVYRVFCCVLCMKFVMMISFILQTKNKSNVTGKEDKTYELWCWSRNRGKRFASWDTSLIINASKFAM